MCVCVCLYVGGGNITWPESFVTQDVCLFISFIYTKMYFGEKLPSSSSIRLELIHFILAILYFVRLLLYLSDFLKVFSVLLTVYII